MRSVGDVRRSRVRDNIVTVDCTKYKAQYELDRVMFEQKETKKPRK